MTQTFFSQCVAVLCSEAPGLAELRLVLEREGYTIKADEDTSEWPEMQSASLTLATDFENGAQCWVDICEFPWPDELGATGDPTLVTGAHMMGAFGPFAHPGAFDRALQAPGYQSAAPDARNHRAFVRFRVSNLIPASAESTEARFASAENANLVWEIAYLLRVAASLRHMPVALAYFNPCSELLLSMQGLAGILTFAFEQKTYPVEAVCRVRGCPADDGWSLVDSIGMEQLGLRDHEFAWSEVEVDPAEQLEFLINLLHYQIDHSAPMMSGHTTDGPQNKLWRAEERETSCMLPLRKVLHWTTESSPPEPPGLKAAVPQDEEPASSSKRAGVPPPLPSVTPASSLSDQAEASKLEGVSAQLIAEIETWLAMRDTIRARAVAWIRSDAFKTSSYSESHFPQHYKESLERCMSEKSAADALRLFQCFGEQSPELWGQYQQLATHGEVLFASAFLCNPGFNTDPNTLLPCGLVAAENQTGIDILLSMFLGEIVGDIYKGDEVKGNERPGIARLVADDQYRVFRRDVLPPEETGGVPFLLLSVLLRKSWMPPDDVPVVPLLAIPGRQGAMVQIPWHVAMGTPPPFTSTQGTRWDRILKRSRLVRSGCLLVVGLFILLTIGGFVELVKYLRSSTIPEDAGRKASAGETKQARRTISTVRSWVQAADIGPKVTVVRPEDYQPLAIGGLLGSGFLLKTDEGLILAASRWSLGQGNNNVPGEIKDRENLTATLDQKQYIRQPESQIQLVTTLSQPASCLDHRPSDLLQNGDILRVIRKKDDWVEGVLETQKEVRLNRASTLLQIRVSPDKDVIGRSGCPVVHAKTGRVIGILLRADKALAPTVLEFETLCVRRPASL